VELIEATVCIPEAYICKCIDEIISLRRYVQASFSVVVRVRWNAPKGNVGAHSSSFNCFAAVPSKSNWILSRVCVWICQSIPNRRERTEPQNAVGTLIIKLKIVRSNLSGHKNWHNLANLTQANFCFKSFAIGVVAIKHHIGVWRFPD